MAKASTLIMRNGQGSQLASYDQIWVIQATDGTQYNVGFLKEFVKKHLFTDSEPPATPTDMGAKADKLVQKINKYGQLQDVAPPVLDMATLRFLKMKKLVLARTIQGACSVCRQKETQHEQICELCGHKHKKAWSGGGACGPTCTCDTWTPGRGGLPANSPLGQCTGFTVNDYEGHRSAKGKLNPFGGSGGQCTGKNDVILMDEIDLQTFKDVVVGAIKAHMPWNDNQTIEGLELVFGPGTGATVLSGDSLTDFNNRAKFKGAKVDVQRNSAVYRIKHWREVIA